MIGLSARFLERKIRKHSSSHLRSRVKALTPIRLMYAACGCGTGKKDIAMRRNDKSWMELDELLEPFLPVEHEQTGTAVAVEFRNRLVKLEQQVMSQYTAMAAYATIAKTDSEAVKVEARADLDRSQATVIGLDREVAQRSQHSPRWSRASFEQRRPVADGVVTADQGRERPRSATGRRAAAAAGEPGTAHADRRPRRAQDARAGLARQQRLGRGVVPALNAEVGSYSCTSSISVPKLPFGWTNATVVPRLPGRGAASIGVAPAATIAASASAQSSTR